jgi:hypothetical protein
MVPSDDGDLGLHTLILHTKEYARLCEQYARRFTPVDLSPVVGARARVRSGLSLRGLADTNRDNPERQVPLSFLG